MENQMLNSEGRLWPGHRDLECLTKEWGSITHCSHLSQPVGTNELHLQETVTLVPFTGAPPSQRPCSKGIWLQPAISRPARTAV